MPNPVFCAMPTHPDHTSAAAGAARTSRCQDRMAWAGGARRGPVRGGRSGGPPRDRTTVARVHGADRVDSNSSHGGHHPSVTASGWGSPVSEASAAATSARLART